ncbi:chemotaxis protein CheW [Geomicrobium sediminis]|uniref:Purine-binding chemotaxis protein CheW n=1 Tax=Geomicrobium sediminis TaxID=1347788 RepID=A0ABS2P8L7_9BACL|nr:purine-binding chemotaxis protein CheW [Geomicrobium sediminis]
MKLLQFIMGGEQYVVDVLAIHSVEKIQDITRVPNAPEGVIGVINVRGLMTTIVDVRGNQSEETNAYTKDTRIVLIEDQNDPLGFIVDQTSNVFTIEDQLYHQALEANEQEENRQYSCGVMYIHEQWYTIFDYQSLFRS